MDSGISYESAMEIAVQFAQRIRAELDSQAEVYLFGSVVTEKNNSQSDIDIAVVSRVFTNDVCANYTRVNKLAFRVDENIDAQAIQDYQCFYGSFMTVQHALFRASFHQYRRVYRLSFVPISYY